MNLITISNTVNEIFYNSSSYNTIASIQKEMLATQEEINNKEFTGKSSVVTVKMNGKSIDESTIEGVQSYMMVYFIIFIVSS